jgi:diguanylate cyclase (GGDEF)-like protein/PAS domain S-box-containing protein
MTTRRRSPARVLRQAAVACGLLALVVGATTLIVGWWWDVPAIRQPIVSASAMRAATALGLGALGLGVVVIGLRWARPVAAVAGGLAGFIGIVALVPYALGSEKTVIESAVALDLALDARIEGQVAINTALALLTAGLGVLLLASRRGAGVRQALGAVTFLIAFTAILGYAAGSDAAAGEIQPGFTAMAPLTAIPLLALGFAIVVVDLSSGWAAILVAPMAGGRLARLLVPSLLGLVFAAALVYSLLAAATGLRNATTLALVGLAAATLAVLIVVAVRLEGVDVERQRLATTIEERIVRGTLAAGEAVDLMQVQFDHAPNGVALVSPTGRIIRVNPAMCELLGHDDGALVGARIGDFAHPEDASRALDQFDRAIAGEVETASPPVRFLRSDGATVWVNQSVGVVRDVEGAPTVAVCSAVDVTEQLSSARRMAELAQLQRVTLDTSMDGIVRLDQDLHIEYMNARLETLTGCASGTSLGRTIEGAGFPAEWASAAAEPHRAVVATGSPTAYEFHADTDGERRWFDAQVEPVRDGQSAVGGLVVTYRDVTERKSIELQLVDLATHDPLTHLANRSAILVELERALSSARRTGRDTAVLLLDLDHFKQVNDVLGHASGDEVVVAAAQLIRETVRAEDVVGRLGGDEFLVIVRDIDDPTQSIRMAQQLLEAFRAPFRLTSHDVYATASVGIALSRGQSTAADLVREADTAMYLAKAEGRDRVRLFDEALAERVSERLRIESELRPALGRGELEVWYQPQVTLVDAGIYGAEALLRWRRADGTVWDAGRFIDVAEDSGLIIDIGSWVMRTACRDAMRWIGTFPGHDFKVSINVSALQLAERDFMGCVDQALLDSGLPPGQLIFEVTETVLMGQGATVFENIQAAAHRGIQLALDDFGTGYASLAYLLEHPFSAIKLDRSFVSGAPSESVSSGLVRGIMRLADAAGLLVVGEGVETREQQDFLISEGCALGQGYLFGKAVPADDLEAMLAEPPPQRGSGPHGTRLRPAAD